MLCKSCLELSAEFTFAVALAAFCGSIAVAEDTTDIVCRQGSRLMLAGREYRAIGANVPHLSQAYIGTWFHASQIYGSPERAKQAIVDALDDAQKSGIAFIRFFANPGYPLDISGLYASNPSEYWRRMDCLFAECRKRNIKLVPSFQSLRGWYLYCGEHAQAILAPKSKTYAATHRYLREFVTRHRQDPTVLMWELENESMLAADVDMEGRELLPAAVYPPNALVREKGAREDSLTWSMTLRLYQEHTAFIKNLDPGHLVSSGDASVRPECTSRRSTFPNFQYRTDTLDEWLSNNIASQPLPLDVFSLHVYGGFAAPSADTWNLSELDLFRRQVNALRAAGRPLFVGEFSQNNPPDPGGRWTMACIDAIEDEGVSLAAIWVWHFTLQPELTMSGATAPALVKRIAAFNRKYAGLNR